MTTITRCFAVLLLLIAVLAGRPVGAEAPVLLIFGDSLSTAYGFDLAEGWVNLLQQRIQTVGLPHRVINASISGDTSRGGLNRLPDTLDRYQPTLMVLELGGNDGLRGLPLTELKSNLAAMIELCQQRGVRVALAEILMPPNYGPVYTQQFQAVFGELARTYAIPLIPFLLNGVAGDRALMQEDGIHPTAAAQPRILDNLWPVLEPLLREQAAPARQDAG